MKQLYYGSVQSAVEYYNRERMGDDVYEALMVHSPINGICIVELFV